MLGILSTIMAIYGVGMIVAFTGAGVKSLVRSSGGSHSAFEKISPRKTKSPAGKAKLRYAFYYKTDNNYVASVVCEKLNSSKFITESTMGRLEKRIDEVFAEFDRQVNKN